MSYLVGWWKILYLPLSKCAIKLATPHWTTALCYHIVLKKYILLQWLNLCSFYGFMDLKMAFTVPRNWLWQKLANYGIDAHWLWLIYALYETSEASIWYKNQQLLSGPFRLHREIRPACVFALSLTSALMIFHVNSGSPVYMHLYWQILQSPHSCMLVTSRW